MPFIEPGPDKSRKIDTRVTIPASMLGKVAEALSHVAGTIYETEDYPKTDREIATQKNGMALREAAKACRVLKGMSGDVEVGFTADEAELIPEALRYVARDMFDGEGEAAETMKAVADQISPQVTFRR